MDPKEPPNPRSQLWGDKRHAPRIEASGSATADFLVPGELQIFNVSRDGVGLSGVVRIGARDNGLVTLHLPGSDEPTAAVATVAWSDHKGRVGLKFIEFRTIASEWQTWFLATAAKEEGRATEEEEVAVPAMMSAELPSPSCDVISDLHTQLKQSAARRSSVRVWLWRALRAASVALVIAAAAAAALWSWQKWQSRVHQAAPVAPPIRAPLATPAPKQQEAARVITTVQVVEGKPSHATPPKNGQAPEIERGKAIYRPDVRHAGRPLPVGKQIVELVLTVAQNGTVSYVTIVSGEPELASEAMAALGHWRYTPFFAGSIPVSVNLPVTAIFRTTRVTPTGKQKW